MMKLLILIYLSSVGMKNHDADNNDAANNDGNGADDELCSYCSKIVEAEGGEFVRVNSGHYLLGT